MAADPQLEAQNPGQVPGGPQEPSQEPSEPYLDQYGHPSSDYVAGCLLKATETCADSINARENAADPDAAQRFGAAAFALAQAYEKVAGKATPPVDPNKVQALDEKARQSDVKHGLAAAKQLDDSARGDQQASQDAAKVVLDHEHRMQQAQQKAEQPTQKPGKRNG